MKKTFTERPATAKERTRVVEYFREHFVTYCYAVLGCTFAPDEAAEELNRVCEVLSVADLTAFQSGSDRTYLRLVMPATPTTVLEGETLWFRIAADKTINRSDPPPFDLPGRWVGKVAPGRRLTKAENDTLFAVIFAEYKQWFGNRYGMTAEQDVIYDYDRMSVIGGFTRDVHALVLPGYFGNADGIFLISHAEVEAAIPQGVHVFKLFDDGHIERATVPVAANGDRVTKNASCDRQS